jgi:3',5'-cyclic AMP phosphodiesterase CpdA
MRLVHLSDLHLGFRQFARQTSAGGNQREADVADTCARALGQVIACAPDVVLVGGDVFHSVRPPNAAIVEAFRQFSRLRSALPEALIVMIAGNHDVPRVSDAGCILQLFSELDVRVVFRGPERIDDAARDLSVLAVPYATPGTAPETPVFTADTRRRYNVLLLHDEVRGVVPDAAQPGDRLYTPIDPVTFEQAPWDYIGLGHYHVYRPILVTEAVTGRRIPTYYSGSLDYTSTNPWSDVREETLRNGALPGAGKGFIEHHLDTGEHRFHAVAVSRRLLDLPRIDATGLLAPELDARIAETLTAAGDGIDDAIVRLVVTNLSRHVLRTLDYAPLRDARRRALHFQLDARRPEGAVASPGLPTTGRRLTLRDRLAERLRERPLAPGLDRDRLVELGLGYLTRAEEQVAAALPVAEG